MRTIAEDKTEFEERGFSSGWLEDELNEVLGEEDLSILIKDMSTFVDLLSRLTVARWSYGTLELLLLQSEKVSAELLSRFAGPMQNLFPETNFTNPLETTTFFASNAGNVVNESGQILINLAILLIFAGLFTGATMVALRLRERH